jgi:cytochrome c-type biogenesis protein CcmH/NrfF
LLIAGIFLLAYLRQRRSVVQAKVLSEAERARVEQLLKD